MRGTRGTRGGLGPRMALARLVAAGNRAARFRLVGVTAGVMVGVALFLLLLGAYRGFGERSERSSGMTNFPNDYSHSLTEADAGIEPGQIAVAPVFDRYRGKIITVVYVADPRDSGVVPKGVTSLPAPGQYVASPALQSLIDEAGEGEIAGRYGEPSGTISADGLEGPDSLVAIVGVADTESLLASGKDAYVTTQFVGNSYASQSYRIIALIGAIATLIPVLVLVAIVTDLGSAQRAERYATLRLIGATPRKVASLAAMETAATALLGSVLGVGLYFLAMPLAARVRVGQSSFYASDLLVPPAAMAAVVAVTVLASAGVSWRRTKRADAGALGVTRERHEVATRWVSALPLLLGLALLGCGVVTPVFLSSVVFVAGFVLCSFGILILGPHVTSVVARALGPRARTASQVMALSRIARHPRASFRAISGIVIAVYMVTVFAVGITVAPGIASTSQDEEHMSNDVLITYLGSNDPAAVAGAREHLAAMPGVEAVAEGQLSPGADSPMGSLTMRASDAADIGLNPPGGSEYVSMPENYFTDDALSITPADDPGQAWHSDVLFVLTDGRASTVERVRTEIMDSGLHLQVLPVTRAENAATSVLDMKNQFASAGYAGILIATGLSAISLAVSTYASLLERRRVFGLLRLAGMPRRTMRGIVLAEAALPVATAFLFSAGLGAFTAWALVSGLSSFAVGWPDGGYFGVLALSLAMVAGAVSVSLRASSRLTSASTVRFE